MADVENGVIFTQSGVPVPGSADYQKVLDSRWRFMEIELDESVSVSIPGTPSVSYEDRYFVDVSVLRHGLPFTPLFETDLDPGPSPTWDIWADDERVFIRREVGVDPLPSEIVKGRVRVYNLPILQDYTAPKDFVVGGSSPKSDVGMQFLEETGGVNLGDRQAYGFSADTRKKILSVHKHGVADINLYSGRSAEVTSIDVTNNLLNLAPDPLGYFGSDISWFDKTGQAVGYSPDDGSTYPGGLSSGVYYIISKAFPAISLAATYTDALAGNAIDITSSGSLPGTLQAQPNPNIPENIIKHDVGYPPTFLLAQMYLQRLPWDLPYPKEVIGPLLNSYPTRVEVDNVNLAFYGVQAQFLGRFGYVILKDPAEVI